MEELIERCAGTDGTGRGGGVCSRSRPGHRPACATGGDLRNHHPDLLKLHDWLAGLGVTDVVMESTGVYRKPVYYVSTADPRRVILPEIGPDMSVFPS
jgi:transposase